MKSYFFYPALGLLWISLFAWMGIHPASLHKQEATTPTPTPTYDPLVEPPVPENPTDYELGRNWYWHYCMPCHGDKGQGLTDEWRSVWEEDHQDCWGRGCHTGERIEDSFPIPTVVPPVISSSKLARFSSLQALYEFLKATHPPQNPGWLQDEQYQAIAIYLFEENDRPLLEPTSTPTPVPTATSTTSSEANSQEKTAHMPSIVIYIGLGLVFVAVMMWGLRKRR